MSWRIGVATGVDLTREIQLVVPELAASGARGVEISTPPGHFTCGDPALVEQLASQLNAFDLEPVSIHVPFGRGLDLASPDRHERDAGLRSGVAAVAALARAGGRIVVAHPSDLERTGLDVARRLEHAVESLEQLAEAAHHAGLTLAVETPLPHLVGGHPDEYQWLLHRLDRSVGSCLDTGHAWLGGHWDALLRVADTRLVHVHASDHHGQRDDHLPPGDGRIDRSVVARGLVAARFEGWIILELHAGGIDDRVGYVRRALEQARTLLANETG